MASASAGLPVWSAHGASLGTNACNQRLSGNGAAPGTPSEDACDGESRTHSHQAIRGLSGWNGRRFIAYNQKAHLRINGKRKRIPSHRMLPCKLSADDLPLGKVYRTF